MHRTHRHVTRNAGTNPVAQAYARQELRRAILDQKIALYLLQTGDPCSELLSGLLATMTLVHTACQLHGMTTPDVGILKASLNACDQVMRAGRYDPLQTVAIATGLDKAMTLAAAVPPALINKAWSKIQHGLV